MLNSLNISQTGLAAAQTAVETVMNNLANENTEGYQKRTIVLSEIGEYDSSVNGNGVLVDGVDRSTSEYLLDNYIKESSQESYYEELSSMLETVETLFEQTDESGFSVTLDNYFQAVENLRSDPTSEVYISDLQNQGSVLVDSLQRLYEGIEDLEQQAEKALEGDIDTVNGILTEIGEINGMLAEQSTLSNELLDRRDLLEQQLAQYVDVEVDRDDDDYILYIGGEVAVRHDTNVRDMTLVEEYTPQIDRYIEDIGDESNILDGLTFDNNDQLTFNLDNIAEVTVTYGEEMSFDIDGDGIPDDVTVDETNYVRALVEKINANEYMADKVSAYNGTYGVDADGNKVTVDNKDYYLLIEANVDGTNGSFTSNISFTEQSNTIEESTSDGPLTMDNITSDTKREDLPASQNMVHTVNFSGSSVIDMEYDFSIDDGTAIAGANFDTGVDYSNVSFTNGVTYDSTTGKITVPPGVDSFEVSFSVINDGTTGDKDYTLNVGDMSATGTIQDETTDAQIIGVTSPTVSESDENGTTELVHNISLTGETAGEDFTFTFDTPDDSPAIDFGEDVTSIDVEYFDAAGVSLGVANVPITDTPITGTITPPAGTTNFNISLPVENDESGEFSESYTLNISDGVNSIDATGTIEDDDVGVSKLINKTSDQSDDAEDIYNIALYDTIVEVSSGSMKANLDNLNTESGDNYFEAYKDQLDAFAKALADMTDEYMNTDDGYVYGESAVDGTSSAIKDVKSLNLFSGSSVSTLTFNETAVYDLDQAGLDYLATLQFKSDIDFENEDSSGTSLIDFFESIRVDVSRDKENVDFMHDTQETVTQSILSSYESLTKVDSDEEMLNLIKFQAAYTANAKVITACDEMLETLLAM